MKINAIDVITMAIDSFTEQTGLSVNQSCLRDIECCALLLDELADRASAESMSAQVDHESRNLCVQMECPLRGFDDYARNFASMLRSVDLPACCLQAWYAKAHTQVFVFIFDRVFSE